MKDTIRPDRLLGPILIGTVINSILYGGCVVQCSAYWMSNSKDDKWIVLVSWRLYICYGIIPSQLQQPTLLNVTRWPFSATPMITVLTSCPAQVYLSWRITCFSKSMRVFVYLLLLAFAQAVLGFTCSIEAFMIPNIGSYHKLIPFVDAWQAATVVCDVSITALLWWYLSKSRAGGPSDNVITSVILMAIETATFGAFFCIMDLATFTGLLSTNLHVIFAFTLNSRKSLRERLNPLLMPDIRIESTPGHHPSRFTQTMQFCTSFDGIHWNPPQMTGLRNNVGTLGTERVLITDLPKDIESQPGSA
ncbi:hypothetical protein BDQ17DRAFT_1356573 [Cyathus striatus]|nr:hypothetical protein BDQ17DRAFT_1356573 [Cyathus striatus]